MEELAESELGTQEYWDNRYDEEIENFKAHGDRGEIWFGENIVQGIIKWMNNSKIQKNYKIIDIGCGNGMFLVELSRNGYNNLHGVDYSQGAITLAKSIANTEGLNIRYSECNILENLHGNFDVIHDKGTYDAISLSHNAKQNMNNYLKNIHKCLDDKGIFIITSCNWTKSELDEHFQSYFCAIDSIPTQQFKFGGKTGNSVTSLIYTKSNNMEQYE